MHPVSISPLLAAKLPQGALASAEEVPLGQTSLSRDTPLHTVVGASIAVCLIDAVSAWCGLRQVMLPSLALGHRHDSMLQADAALEDIFNRLCAAANTNPSDAAHKRMRAKIFGGADLGASGLCFSDGAQSIGFVQSWLSSRHIAVAAESLGGKQRREIVLLPNRGSVYCRALPLDNAFLSEERSLLTASHQETSKVELF
jgi:chemotaxis protein CheD